MNASYIIRNPSLSGRGVRNLIFHGSFRRLAGVCLMYLVIIEAAVFGSGQMLHAGPLTFKMLLFGFSMLYVAVALTCGERIGWTTLLLESAYLLSIVVASLIGILRSATTEHLIVDINPLLSFLLLPFFELTIQSYRQVVNVARVMMIAPLAIVAAYLGIMLSLWTGRVHYADLADWLGTLGNGDFMFDESMGRVFYKGAIYLGIALFFFLFHRRSAAKIGAMFMILNLAVIGTRGFFLALFLTGVLYVFIGPIKTPKKISLLLPLILAGVILLPKVFMLAGNRGESDLERVVTVRQVLDRTNVLTVIGGNGFGIGVPERPEHMEIVYLEILYKQGLIGMCWWGTLFAVLVIRFYNSLVRGNSRLAYPFFLGCAFVAFESFTNPFIDNPIGMTFVTISLACLNVLGVTDNRTNPISSTFHNVKILPD